MSSIQDQYEQVSYPHYVHPLTNPARLAALGRILGLRPADPTKCQVLDVGCSSGSNLLAMAARFPHSQFDGIDFAAPEIAAGQALAAESGLRNVTLQQADLLTWKATGPRYDYIIAYGMFSWVSDEVKDRLLQICRECLAPNGIACFSYMTYPGCKQTEAIRDLLKLRTEHCLSPAEKVSHAHQVLDFLDHAYAGLPGMAHSKHLRELVQQIRRKQPNFLIHDELGVERDPCYLLQFVQWAAEHQLAYAGESEFHMMFLENLPPESARELAAMGLDRLETEQMIDYVVNRSFRCSLLVPQESSPTARLDAAALRQLCLKPLLQPVAKSKPDLTEGRFITSTDTKVTLRSLPLVTFVRALAGHPDSFTPFAEILTAAEELAGHPFSPEEQTRLCEDLSSLLVRRQLEVSALPFSPPAKVPEKPKLTPLNLAYARRHALVTTASQEAIRLDPTEQSLCSQLDGTRNLTELQQSGQGQALGKRIEALLERLRQCGCLVDV